MFNGFLAVGIGAACGAWIRWMFALLFNSTVFPIGTLIANLLGAYLMGVAFAAIMHIPNISSEMRLFITTGFLGGMTTFSTFSLEAFNLIDKQQYTVAVSHILSHVLGSILMTWLGYITYQYFKH